MNNIVIVLTVIIIIMITLLIIYTLLTKQVSIKTQGGSYLIYNGMGIYKPYDKSKLETIEKTDNKLFDLIFKEVKDVLKTIEVDNTVDRIVVGDVHGNLITFFAPLVRAGFITADDISFDDDNKMFVINNFKETRTRVIYTGDIIHRGKHRHAVKLLYLLVSLARSYPNNVVFVFGNHDLDYVMYGSGMTDYEMDECYSSSIINTNNVRFNPWIKYKDIYDFEVYLREGMIKYDILQRIIIDFISTENNYTKYSPEWIRVEVIKFYLFNEYSLIYFDDLYSFSASHTVFNKCCKMPLFNRCLIGENGKCKLKTDTALILMKSLIVLSLYYVSQPIRFTKTDIYEYHAYNLSLALYWARPEDKDAEIIGTDYHTDHQVIGHTPVYDFNDEQPVNPIEYSYGVDVQTINDIKIMPNDYSDLAYREQILASWIEFKPEEIYRYVKKPYMTNEYYNTLKQIYDLSDSKRN